VCGSQAASYLNCFVRCKFASAPYPLSDTLLAKHSCFSVSFGRSIPRNISTTLYGTRAALFGPHVQSTELLKYTKVAGNDFSNLHTAVIWGDWCEYCAFVEIQHLLNRYREESVAVREPNGLSSRHESLPVITSRELTNYHVTKAYELSRHESLIIVTSRKLTNCHVTKTCLLSRHEILPIITSRKLTNCHVTKAYELSRHESLRIITSRKLTNYHVTKVY